MALTEHWADMLSNRERNGFNADPLEPGYVKFRAPKSDNLSLTYGRPESGLVAEARLQLTSGGEAIPPKTLIPLLYWRADLGAHTKPMRARKPARWYIAGRYKVTN